MTSRNFHVYTYRRTPGLRAHTRGLHPGPQFQPKSQTLDPQRVIVLGVEELATICQEAIDGLQPQCYLPSPALCAEEGTCMSEAQDFGLGRTYG